MQIEPDVSLNTVFGRAELTEGEQSSAAYGLKLRKKS